MHSEGRVKQVALVIDTRGGGQIYVELTQALKVLDEYKLPYEIVFLEASDEVLVRRFKESRRRHPLFISTSTLLDAIRTERSMLEELRGKANVVIDTSPLTPRELKEELKQLYSDHQSGGFSVNVESFGYKMGIPLDSDIVIDVRFLPNPYYDPLMRNMTGEDQEVIDYVLGSPVTKGFLRRFLNLLKFLIPYYMEEGKTNLAVAIGCTGGQHRSVVLANYVAKQLKKSGYNIIIRHRDILKNKSGGKDES